MLPYSSTCDFLYHRLTRRPVNLEIDDSAHRTDVIQYITNPCVYYAQNILETPEIHFKIESVYKRLLGIAPETSDECVVVMYPIRGGNNYFNSHAILYPLEYIDPKDNKAKRKCSNCLKVIRPRKHVERDFANRRCCVSCARNASRTDVSEIIRKIDYLG